MFNTIIVATATVLATAYAIKKELISPDTILNSPKKAYKKVKEIVDEKVAKYQSKKSNK